MPTQPPVSPCSAESVAQARFIVTRYDVILAEVGPVAAIQLRQDAWDVLLADHAARLVSRRRAKLLPGVAPVPGDAA